MVQSALSAASAPLAGMAVLRWGRPGMLHVIVPASISLVLLACSLIVYRRYGLHIPDPAARPLRAPARAIRYPMLAPAVGWVVSVAIFSLVMWLFSFSGQ